MLQVEGMHIDSFFSRLCGSVWSMLKPNRKHIPTDSNILQLTQKHLDCFKPSTLSGRGCHADQGPGRVSSS
jgi:hypothetical protein